MSDNYGRPEEELVKRWRKLKMHGALYWKKRANKYRYSMFERDDVAVYVDGPYKMHFKTMEAIEEFVAYQEYYLNAEED